MKESYYLKFNSSDTLYYISSLPLEQKNSFTILKKEDKKEIQNVLDSITFPENKILFESDVNDGTTYAFNLKREKEIQKLKVHGRFAGPKQFWIFGERLDEIIRRYQFIPTDKKIDLTEIDSMVINNVKFLEQ